MIQNIELFIEELNKNLKEGEKAEYVETKKNNNVVKHGVKIILENSSIVPVIYVDDIEEGSVEDEVKTFMNIIENADMIPKITLNNIDQWEVIPCAINRNLNDQFKGPNICVSSEIMIVFRLRSGKYSILVTEDMVKAFPSLTKAYLYEKAYKNRNYKVENMLKLLEDKFGIELTEEDLEDHTELMVVTTEDMQYGAGVLGNKDFLEEISQKYYNGEDYIIIPSSIHEIITTPRNQSIAEGINDTICSVNDTEVEDQEVLGTAALLYNAEERSIRTLYR